MRLVLGRDPFFAKGFNCYFLSFCSDAVREASLLSAKRLGANTIRSWAFLDVMSRARVQVGFQYLNGNEICRNNGPDGLGRLDHLIATAEDLNLKLILPLVNYWPDFGGMPMYLKWFGLPETDPAEFFRSPRTRGAFRVWIDHILHRRNNITGRPYYEEPAILAWELANEPRSMGVDGRELLLDWIEEMSGFVKERDSNHLLGVGDEGFFHQRGRSHLYNGMYGVDFEAILRLPAIDLGTFHLYLQHWGESLGSDFPRRWIRDHTEAAAKAEKPVILEEFGISEDDDPEMTEESRQALYRDWTNQIQAEGGAGALIWMLGSRSAEVAGFRDKYTLYYPERTEMVEEDDLA